MCIIFILLSLSIHPRVAHVCGVMLLCMLDVQYLIFMRWQDEEYCYFCLVKEAFLVQRGHPSNGALGPAPSSVKSSFLSRENWWGRSYLLGKLSVMPKCQMHTKNNFWSNACLW